MFTVRVVKLFGWFATILSIASRDCLKKEAEITVFEMLAYTCSRLFTCQFYFCCNSQHWFVLILLVRSFCRCASARGAADLFEEVLIFL